MQMSLTDYLTTEKNTGWKLPLWRYKELPESRELPKDTLIDTDLSKETPDNLMRFSATQLEVLCMFWGAPKSGPKAKKTESLLNAYDTYQTIAKAGEAGLLKLTVPELRALYRRLERSSGSWLVKKGLVKNLLLRQEAVHEPFWKKLAEARHYEGVSAALRLGKPVPEEVIRSCPEYTILYRKAKGLPTRPEEMTGEQWAAYAPLVAKNSHMTDKEREVERHWRIIKSAIKANKRLSPEVIADHEERTRIRAAERQRATPRGPGWEPVDLRTVKPGDILRLTDGVEVRVVETGDRVIALNLFYNWEETLEEGRVWYKTPFCIGDKVWWTGPDKQVKTGRIKHVCPSYSSVFGEEFFIETGRNFIVTGHPEFFRAPVGEVEKTAG